MSLLSLLTDWKWTKTTYWFPWERTVLCSITPHIADNDVRVALESLVDSVFEVYRGRQGHGYYSSPAFWQEGKLPDVDQVLATLAAHANGHEVNITVEIGAGMISRINIAGQRLPRPDCIVLQNIGVPVVTLPIPKKLPVVSGWLKRLCANGLVAPGNLPLAQEEIERYKKRFPNLPVDYFEFCAQTDGGAILPNTEGFAIFGLRDISPSHTPKSRAFIPLVDMRELGGLGCFVAEEPQPIMDFSTPEGVLFADTFEAAIVRVAKEAP